MLEKKGEIDVVVFTGGRGTESISKSFTEHKQIRLTLLINGYDDGLSTGKIRKFIPGMLGPSDFRKNLAHLTPRNEQCFVALAELLEFRFPKDIKYEEARGCLQSITLYQSENLLPELQAIFLQLKMRQVHWIKLVIDRFINYLDSQYEHGKIFQFGDCSLGNILIAGCYIHCDYDFNRTIFMMNDYCEVKGKILNVTQGENYLLCSCNKDGSISRDEASIVSSSNKGNIHELFLLEKYLTDEEIKKYQKLSFDELIQAMRNLSKTPKIDYEAKSVLENADVIIYGPGTQHSSLFPTYLTKGVTEAIKSNKNAEKIFIGNIFQDFDIIGEEINDLVKKCFYYLSRKKTITFSKKDLITRYFLHKSDSYELSKGGKKYLGISNENFEDTIDKVYLADWESIKGSHIGGKILNELIGIVQSKIFQKIDSYHYLISIVVVGLNEENTVKQVLHALKDLNFEDIELGKEIIFVDGGSTDKTLEYASAISGIRVFQLDSELKGKGEALKCGIQKAKGNIIVSFPSDLEYKIDDIRKIVNPIVNNEAQVVFGSRSIKCLNIDKRMREIYKGNHILSMISKYGGLLLSICCLVFYNRYISDPLSSLKGYNANILNSLSLKKSGFDLEMEILAKLSKRGIFILDIPVEFLPRTKEEGKKIKTIDGINSLFTLITQRFIND